MARGDRVTIPAWTGRLLSAADDAPRRRRVGGNASRCPAPSPSTSKWGDAGRGVCPSAAEWRRAPRSRAGLFVPALAAISNDASGDEWSTAGRAIALVDFLSLDAPTPGMHSSLGFSVRH